MNNMREILFKAKDKDDGKWYEGYYMCLHDTTYCSMPSDNLAESKRLEEENTHHYIVFELMTDWGLPNRHLRAEIIPETLCQYTGLADKNGKKIWENDIVYARCKGLSAKGIIAYEKGCLVIKDNKRQRTYSLFGDWKLRTDGNIFDNAELLEG